MRVSRLLSLALVIGIFAGIAPNANAADAPGTIYLDSNVLSTTTPAVPCVADVIYGAAVTAPAAGKAYIGTSTEAIACSIAFDYVVETPFALGGDITVSILLGCTVTDAITEVDADVSIAGTVVDAGTRHSNVAIPPAPCPPGGTSAWTWTLPHAGEAATTGDIVQVTISVWGNSPPPAQPGVGNIYVITGAATSSISAVGIPAPSTVGAESINLAVAKTSASALPGGAAYYNLTVNNLGAATKFTLASSGLPNGYAAAFNPLSGDMAAGSNTTATLKVTIPSSAAGGTSVPFKVKVTGTAGANKTIELTIVVAKASTTTGPGVTSGPGGTDQPGATTDEGVYTDEDGNVVSGTKPAPGIEFASNVLAIGLLVVAMRRRLVR